MKSNLLYDATTTMNLGLEIGLARKWTLDIPVNYNPWKLPTANASVIGGYNPKFVTGFVRVFAVCLSECTDIMPISM